MKKILLGTALACSVLLTACGNGDGAYHIHAHVGQHNVTKGNGFYKVVAISKGPHGFKNWCDDGGDCNESIIFELGNNHQLKGLIVSVADNGHRATILLSNLPGKPPITDSAELVGTDLIYAPPLRIR